MRSEFPPVSTTYKRILIPLDHSDQDRDAVAHGAAIARSNRARVYLVHVEEGVTSLVYGEESKTVEVESGREYLERIQAALKSEGIESELIIVHGNRPADEIVRVARSVNPDLVVMAAHGHRWWKDIILGTTINAVRHELAAPVLIVQATRPSTD